MRRLAWFLIGAAVVWVVASPLALLVGDWPRLNWPGLLTCTAAFFLCLVPSALALLLVVWSDGRPGTDAMLAALGGMALRFVFVLGGGIGLYYLLPVLHDRPLTFWGWVMGFYLLSLAGETALAVARPAGAATGGR
jgi:hypothetical protein